jgi:hypothetical protein
MPAYEIPGVWRKCSLAIDRAERMQFQSEQRELPAMPLARHMAVADSLSSMTVKPLSPPNRFWKQAQSKIADALATAVCKAELQELTKVAKQMECNSLTESDPIACAVAHTLHQAVVGECSTLPPPQQSDSALVLQLQSAKSSVKEIALAMKALSWNGLAIPAVIQRLAVAAIQLLSLQGGSPGVAPNHLVDIILQIADAGADLLS